MLSNKKLSDVYNRAMSEGLDSLSDEEREIYLIQDFIIEFEMGGLSGYFYNRLPIQLQIASSISAMRKHGLISMAEYLNEAFQLFQEYYNMVFSETWSEILKKYDPDNRLAIIEKRIDAIENYGIENSFIRPGSLG